ncbi:MAG: hydantoinase/oxoprolinase family protein [Dehalococcoidia bacterium]|nr:hydantoinase/oxoprolinase family protein [Dehalococcoidia bacterium]
MSIGVDVGGTFTDIVREENGALYVLKVPSTPADHAEAFLRGLDRLGDLAGETVVHGSTVATNAILERKGAKTALITTRGFKDILVIARQNRPELYDLEPRKLAPLVPENLTFEVDERVDFEGRVVVPLSVLDAERAIDDALNAGAESLAVCLLFSFLHPDHENQIAEMARARGLIVSKSSWVLPEFREYERAATTVVNAYVSPVMGRYLGRLSRELSDKGIGSFRIMQSNGGSASPEFSIENAARTVLSGPAAGVVGAAYVANAAGIWDVLSFDMGGTSTDVSLCPGRIQETVEGVVGGVPIRLPMVYIHTVGAGGGSIARVDAGRMLRVGPESAGADPGPACYGVGDMPTVTDAQLVLGRLSQDYQLGGSIRPDIRRARDAIEKLGDELGLGIEQAAQGIVRVANANMERALRVISVERGYDPRLFTLVAFGGAGPLHACDLAASLGLAQVLAPLYPGVLSAIGAIFADVVKDFSSTVMWRLGKEADYQQLAMSVTSSFRPLLARGWGEIRAEGFPNPSVRVLLSMDMRYHGQSYELNVPIDGLQPHEFASRFHLLYQHRFGYAQPEEPVEIVNLRLKMVGVVDKPSLPRIAEGGPDPSQALLEKRTVWFDAPRETNVYERSVLKAGNVLAGPAIVVQMDATTIVPPGWSGAVDSFGHLLMRRKE